MWQQLRKCSDLSNNQTLLSVRENKHRCFLLVTYSTRHLKSSLTVSLCPYCYIFLQHSIYIVSCNYSSVQLISSLSSCPPDVLCLVLLCSFFTIRCCLSSLLSASLCCLLPYIHLCTLLPPLPSPLYFPSFHNQTLNNYR